MKKMKKVFIFILILIIVLAIITGGVYLCFDKFVKIEEQQISILQQEFTVETEFYQADLTDEEEVNKNLEESINSGLNLSNDSTGNGYGANAGSFGANGSSGGDGSNFCGGTGGSS